MVVFLSAINFNYNSLRFRSFSCGFKSPLEKELGFWIDGLTGVQSKIVFLLIPTKSRSYALLTNVSQRSYEIDTH